jgi:hypothetical protein
MSASGYQQLPRYLIQFSMLTKGMSCSDDVAAILIAIGKAIRAPTPRTALNRALTRLHRYRRTGMRQLITWIASDKVLATLRSKGAWWTLPLCVEAFEKMSQGITPHVALGMHLPGKRPNMNFSITRDASLLANHLIQIGTPFREAISVAQNFREQCLPTNSDTIPQLRPLQAKLSEKYSGVNQSLVAHLELKYGRKIQTNGGLTARQ